MTTHHNENDSKLLITFIILITVTHKRNIIPQGISQIVYLL